MMRCAQPLREKHHGAYARRWGIGKKVKGLLNSVVKVGTLGATDLNGKGWGRGIVDPLGIVSGASDQLLGTDFSGAKADAAKAGAATAAREVQAQTFAQNMSVDLGSANVANVDLGGTADATTGNRRKKRPGASSASSSLGINY